MPFQLPVVVSLSKWTLHVECMWRFSSRSSWGGNFELEQLDLLFDLWPERLLQFWPCTIFLLVVVVGNIKVSMEPSAVVLLVHITYLFNHKKLHFFFFFFKSSLKVKYGEDYLARPLLPDFFFFLSPSQGWFLWQKAPAAVKKALALLWSRSQRG